MEEFSIILQASAELGEKSCTKVYEIGESSFTHFQRQPSYSLLGFEKLTR